MILNFRKIGRVSLVLLCLTHVLHAVEQHKQKAKVAFVIQELSFRGIEVATFDYAHYNETLLGN